MPTPLARMPNNWLRKWPITVIPGVDLNHNSAVDSRSCHNAGRSARCWSLHASASTQLKEASCQKGKQKRKQGKSVEERLRFLAAHVGGFGS